jgi:uncharacterized protein (TIGR03083 family)
MAVGGCRRRSPHSATSGPGEVPAAARRSVGRRPGTDPAAATCVPGCVDGKVEHARQFPATRGPPTRIPWAPRLQPVDVPVYVEQLRRDGERLATVASLTDPGAPVPTCPDWSLRDLVRHVGGVHRWATGFVRGAGRQPPDGDLERFVGGWPQDDKLVEWFADGHRVLVEALDSATADLETWTFLEAPTPLAFWARRQAHETAIHRVDAESAGGDVTGFPSDFAIDGIDELLLRFANRPGRPLPAVETTRSMVVRAKDEPRSWRVTFAPSGFQIEADPIDDDAELLVTGDASELYVLLWNRRDAAGSEMVGETDLVDLWRETVQIRWS